MATMEPRGSARPLLLVLLAACLALLATTVTLGVCYWQVSTTLVQSQDQLAETRAEGDCSQKELQGRDTELQKARAAVGKVREKLAWMQEQAQDLQEQLSKTAGALACSRADCCPETWVLHHGKCLFLSKEKKTWSESLATCAANFSRLLVLRDWDLMTMLSFFTNMDTSYWIGLRYNRVWTWIDGTPYPQ
ncbi:C-type lectin domain family 1 member A-like [Alligator sinensis]|uniref:C-type lectin domain family 1 member A-like n=1 Tax=Alligator sinensis TaxID=38654 RepID=A0A3Q0FVH1_ALLSI|nr:C-type lectin domain family 1 member A-like [Alligator sinensis]